MGIYAELAGATGRPTEWESIIVVSVRGLPLLTDRHEYTQKEIENAVFTFSKYTIVPSFRE